MKKHPKLKDDLSNYRPEIYKDPSVTVDVAICRLYANTLQVLLIKRGEAPFRGKWALPGGFLDVDKDETLYDAASRELLEETAIQGGTVYLEQLGTYGDKRRDPRKRVVTVAYFALLSHASLQRIKPKAGDDAAAAEWFSMTLVKMDLAFDHSKIVSDLLARLRGKAWYSSVIFRLLPEWFTWTQLQDAYTTITGVEYTATNFRRKIMRRFQIAVLSHPAHPTRGRPGQLLKFVDEKEF